MSVSAPIICFGQQPCGFLPKRFLVAKVLTARRIQSELGGEIVFFCHDSDHDPRETRTILRHRKHGEPFEFNFTFENKLQRKFSPLFLKRVREDWREKTSLQMPAYLGPEVLQAFRANTATNVADFCLNMYQALGMLDGVRVVRSSDPEFRRAACEVDDFFVDVPLEGETVRARHLPDGKLQLHEGGNSFRDVPWDGQLSKERVSPTRDTRLRWMQSVLKCTHYIAGAGEQQYLRKGDAPEITYLSRDPIERSDEAWADLIP